MRPNREVQEIANVLRARPEVKELFDIILSIPEKEKRNEAAEIALGFLRGRK